MILQYRYLGSKFLNYNIVIKNILLMRCFKSILFLPKILCFYINIVVRNYLYCWSCKPLTCIFSKVTPRKLFCNFKTQTSWAFGVLVEFTLNIAQLIPLKMTFETKQEWFLKWYVLNCIQLKSRVEVKGKK